MSDLFLQFSAEITGYPASTLQGTGLVELYSKLVGDVLGPALAPRFYAHAEAILSLGTPQAREQRITELILHSPIFWPVTANLIALWYLGLWTKLPDEWYQAQGLGLPGPSDPGRTHVPSASAYTEQLSYRTAGAHPPGAKPTGFQSWSVPPVF